MKADIANNIIAFKLPPRATFILPPHDLYDCEGGSNSNFFKNDRIHLNNNGYEASSNSPKLFDLIISAHNPLHHTSTTSEPGIVESEFLGRGWDGQPVSNPHNLSPPAPRPHPQAPQPMAAKTTH